MHCVEPWQGWKKYFQCSFCFLKVNRPMESFLRRTLYWKKEKVKEFIGDSTDEQVVQRLLDWQDDTSAREVSHGLYIKVLPQLKRERCRIQLREWAEKWKLVRILEQASLFELETVITHNPYYLLIAFHASYQACFDLIEQLHLRIDPECVMYALVVDQLRSHKSLSLEQVSTLFQKYGMQPTRGVHEMNPFPENYLAHHELVNIDPELVASASLEKYVSHRGELVTKIRERRFMVNRVRLVGHRYKLRTYSTEFVRQLAEISRRAPSAPQPPRKKKARLGVCSTRQAEF